MPELDVRPGNGSFGRLRSFLQPRPAAERCDLCGVEIAAHHDHLLEPATRHLRCACTACALLFARQDDGRYRRVPMRVLSLPDFRLSAAQWDAMGIPINLAFFYRTTAGQVVACYPGPAGATESLIRPGDWEQLLGANPVLSDMEDDVEALLVNRAAERRGDGEPEYFLVPADTCYALIGLMRMHWQGFSGGDAVWQEIGQFFDQLRNRAKTFEAVADA